VSAVTLGVLVATALAASIVSGIIGMGGGILLLAVMASLLDPVAVVPLHGVVQLVSNGTRTVRLVRHVDWRIFALYVPGLALGAWIGIGFYDGAQAAWFRPVVGGFVLAFLLWERVKPRRLVVPMWVFVPAGVGGGILTVMVGATGPYLAAFFLRDDLERRKLVGTKAAIQSVGHLAKIPAFLSIGFDYGAHVTVLGPLIASVVLGTVAGTSLLARMNERAFQAIFRVVLALLGLRLLFTS
jgi:uncharacterized membrane protein YfcA